MNDKAFMQTNVDKNGNSSATNQNEQAKEKINFDIKSLAGKMGFMMFDGYQDNVMQSSVVEKEAAQESTDKTIIETSNAASGGPDPEKPDDEDSNQKDYKVEKTENLAVSMDAVHNIGGESRK